MGGLEEGPEEAVKEEEEGMGGMKRNQGPLETRIGVCPTAPPLLFQMITEELFKEVITLLLKPAGLRTPWSLWNHPGKGSPMTKTPKPQNPKMWHMEKWIKLLNLIKLLFPSPFFHPFYLSSLAYTRALLESLNTRLAHRSAKVLPTW